MPEPESLVLQLLRDMRGDMARMDKKIDNVGAEINSLRADVASELITTRKELSEQIVGLRRAVVEYHSAVNGVIISEFEARVRRLEQRIGVED